MSLKRLRDILSEVGNLVEATGSKKVASEIREFAEILPGQDTDHAREAVSELQRLLDEERTALRQSYAQRFEAAGADRPLFETVYAELAGDRRVLKEDADAIAQLYIAGRATWPTKAAALKAIRNRFADRAYGESKMKIVEKSKVW